MFLINRKFVLAAIFAAALALPLGASGAVQAADDNGILHADRKDWKHGKNNWKKGPDHRGNRKGGPHDRDGFHPDRRPGDHNGRPGPRPGEMNGQGSGRPGMPPHNGSHPGGSNFQPERPGFGGPGHPDGMRPGGADFQPHRPRFGGPGRPGGHPGPR